MKKRTLMVTLSMALVVGVAGIVNAATMGSNTTDTSTQPSNTSAYVNHNNVPGMGAVPGTTSQTNQTLPAQTAQTQSSQPDQTSTTQTDIYTPMSSNASINNMGQNMSPKMQTMPMSTPMNGQMSNMQSMQGMGGTRNQYQANASSATQPSSQNSSVKTMMGSSGRMGR
ncbi:hypothetical protein [Desulfosporosinus sp. SB140]|uniref:hypothetical protein n=1 Tax=Desulfosporosinus paludis TaxID=3115649 RepID=UPI003890372D